MLDRKLKSAQRAAGEIPPQVVAAITPEFVRLPRAGQRCPYTGMSRSAINALILATPPAVKSYVLRRPDARTGIRLIEYRSLVDYIRGHVEEGVGCE